MSETLKEVPAPNAPTIVVDADGRKLEVKKLDILEELDLIEVAGEASENRRWMMLTTLACCVRSINGVPILYPKTKKALRDHVAKVGPVGIAAVVDLYRAELPPDVGEEAGGSAGQEEIATAKN